MLTDKQVRFFNTFGYIVVPSLFSSKEVNTISDTFDEVFENHTCTACVESAFGGENRHMVVGFVESRPALVNLVEDDRIFEPLSQLLDHGFVWVASDGNLYVGDTNWHSDKRSSTGYRQIKVSMYLDPVNSNTGCLRVIPGSHEQPFNDVLRSQLLGPSGKTGEELVLDSFGMCGSEIPCAKLESVPGDVVFFRQEIFHASYGGGVGRRMFAMGIFDKPKTEDEISSVSRIYTHHRSQADESDISAFFNSDRPRLRAMSASLKEIGIR